MWRFSDSSGITAGVDVLFRRAPGPVAATFRGAVFSFACSDSAIYVRLGNYNALSTITAHNDPPVAVRRTGRLVTAEPNSA